MGQVRLTKKGIYTILTVLCVVSFGLGFGLWKVTGLPNLSPTDSSAAGGCKDAVDKKDCNGCSPNKPNGESYECVWRNNECKDGNNICGGGGGGGISNICDGVPVNPKGTRKCNLGAKLCQEDSKGSYTGYNCTCVDISTASECRTDWRCTDFDKGACPTDSDAPIVGSCGKVEGSCVVYDSPVTYNVYTCPGMSTTEGSTYGCNDGTPKVVTGKKVCPGVSGSFCGWVQADDVNNKLCFRSWYFPCDSSEEPVVPTTPDGNICEGGGITKPTDRVVATVGQTVEFCGYAYDKDGIDVNNVNVRIDGTVVGKATVTDACANASDPICTQYAGKKPVKWCYTYTATEEGDKTISAVWKDTKNVGGVNCRAEMELTTAVVQDNWIVDKNAGRVCLDSDLNNVRVGLNYTITITNSAEEIKEISKIVDTLDSKVQSSYIKLETINPGASVSGNVITWDLTGEMAKFNPGQTKTFTYSLEIPKSAFGTYYNQAVITPVGSDTNIEVDETIIASCDVPDTAIFDSVQSKIAVGVFLVLVALLYAYIDPMDTGVGRLFRKVSYNMSDGAKVIKSREKFEKRVVS
jgi:hypothetical protein